MITRNSWCKAKYGGAPMRTTLGVTLGPRLHGRKEIYIQYVYTYVRTTLPLCHAFTIHIYSHIHMSINQCINYWKETFCCERQLTVLDIIDVESVLSWLNQVADKMKSLSKLLSKSVTCLRSRSGQSIYVLGTAHVSKRSCEQAVELISVVKPSAVLLELCEQRGSTILNQKNTVRPQCCNDPP